MNKAITIFTASMFIIAGANFIGCQSSEQKVESAHDNLHDAAEDLDKVVSETKAEELKLARAEEWKIFKAESEVKIKENEVRILELKGKMKKSGKMLDEIYSKRIEVLEQQNNNLLLKIDAYEKNQSDWEKFKLEFNRDMDGLGQALKEFTETKK